MTQIEKIKAEIERLIERAKAERILHPKTILAAKDYLLIEDYNKLLSFIESLEQEPAVDLEKEIQSFWNANALEYRLGRIADINFLAYTARHFFELGLSARKEARQ